MDFKPNLRAEVQVRPSRSQVVLVMLTVLSAGCFFSGFAFLWEGKSDAWIPILIGMCVFFFVVFAWWRAQKDTDLENSNPTTVLDGSGNQITTDTRALMSPDGIQHMERIISALAHRAPLPEPDGLIDHEGNPIPNTKEDARLRVDAANHEAQTATNNAAGALGFYQEREYGIQPLIDEPYSEDVIKTNVKKTDV